MAEEVPFLADQRPWEYANLVACGTPQTLFEPTTELVVAQPPVRGRPTGRPLLASMEGKIKDSDWRAYRKSLARFLNATSLGRDIGNQRLADG